MNIYYMTNVRIRILYMSHVPRESPSIRGRFFNGRRVPQLSASPSAKDILFSGRRDPQLGICIRLWPGVSWIARGSGICRIYLD